jgi:aminoglycoside N3'-acetyltransferase
LSHSGHFGFKICKECKKDLFHSVEKIVYVDPAVEKFATILPQKNILKTKVENPDHSFTYCKKLCWG